MPSRELIDAYSQARARHQDATRDLVALVISIAVATLEDVLPGVRQIETLGEFNEDWVPTLRIERVVGLEGETLFDVELGYDERSVEDAVGTVDTEFLDVLIDLTGSEYMGRRTIERPDETTPVIA